MELKIFSVYDSKVEAYLTPFFFPSRGHALRHFGDLANDPSSLLCKHAADFTLFELGHFDDSNAMLLVADHVNLGKALEFKTAELFQDAAQ